MRKLFFFFIAILAGASCLAQNAPRNYPEPKPGDFTATGFSKPAPSAPP